MEEKMTVLAGEFYETNDMSVFKRLTGNRAVSEERVAKIERSVRKIGWITPTVVVNEKMEVIDGQGRIEVARRYGLPVSYQVVEGLGADECAAMNLEQTNWTLQDFCRSWEERGNENYRRFNEVLNEHSEIPFSVVFCAITGYASAQNDVVKKGLLRCSEEQVEFGGCALEWLEGFDRCWRQKVGSKMLAALLFVYTLSQSLGVDLERVQRCLESYNISAIESFSTIKAALVFIESRYNSRLSAKARVYFAHEYQKVMAEKHSWYTAKWGRGLMEETDR